MREISNLESRPQPGKSSNERPLGIIALKMLKIGLENKGLPAGRFCLHNGASKFLGQMQRDGGRDRPHLPPQ